MAIVASAPATIGPIPAGVPVKMMSPGSNVITRETKLMISGTLKIMSLSCADCLTSPATVAVIFCVPGMKSVSIHGPSGQKVSKLFARVH